MPYPLALPQLEKHPDPTGWNVLLRFVVVIQIVQMTVAGVLAAVTQTVADTAALTASATGYVDYAFGSVLLGLFAGALLSIDEYRRCRPRLV